MKFTPKIQKIGCFLLLGIFFFSQWALPVAQAAKYPVQWDLSQLVDSEESWQSACAEARTISQEIASLRGTLVDPEAILALREWKQKFENVIGPLVMYVQLSYSLDPTNPEILQRRAAIYQILQEYQGAIAYIDPEIYALPLETRQKIFQDSRLIPYQHYYERYMNPDYQALPEVVTQIIQPYQLANQQFVNVYDILSYVERPDPTFILPNGEEIVLDDQAYVDLIRRDDYGQDVKLAACETYLKKYNGFSNTYAALYQGKIASTWADAQLYGYTSTRSYAMAQEDIPESAYRLMQQAVRGSLDQLQKYLKAHKEGLGKDTQYSFDLQQSCSNYVPHFTYDEAVDRVRDALSILGVEYIQAYNQLVSSGHIDVYPAPNKSTGAYTTQSIGNESSKMSYMMLNFQGSDQDVSTLAHEAGHALYGWFSQKEQPSEYEDPTIFTHEVASTTNELLYYMYSIDHAANEEERLYYLEKGLELFYGTLFMQTLYAEFEDFAHERVENGGALDASTLDQKWQELYQDYRGDTVQMPTGLKGQWAQIPHFFESDFYVYKYACDICYASVLAQQIYQGDAQALERYQQFLGKGSSESPMDLLASVGVDILDPLIYQESVNLFVQWLDQYRAILQNR